MNNNVAEITSLIYDDKRGLAAVCSEIRHDRNRGETYGRIGYFLNGFYLNVEELREQFLAYLRELPISHSISIDSRILNDSEIMDVLVNSQDLREVRIIDNGYVLTKEVLNKFNDNVTIVCDEVAFSDNNDRVYVQHGLFKKETNYVEDDLVSAYFINRDLSDEEVDYLVSVINNDNNNASYCQLSFRLYNPSLYKNLISRLHERGLREDVRINLLGNPLYDRSEVYAGINNISNNPISITYDTCNDMISYYMKEPYSVSNMYRSELEGGGNASFDSYLKMLSVLEEQEKHIKDHNYTPLEAAIYAYRFLQKNYAYDPNFTDTDSENVLTNRQLDIVASNSTLVCVGYSTLYSALMRRCGIPMFRYSTENHVRNIARIVDSKYDIDNIAVFDSTFDGSRILDDGTFDESRSFKYFMFSPREAVFYDPYVTIPTSLVLNYGDTGFDYLSFISKDPYENNLSLTYSADSYAVTMLDMMGIQLPEPLTFESYRELLSRLNQTSIFNNVSSNAFVQAYETVLRSEDEKLSELDITLYLSDALHSINDRFSFERDLTPVVSINSVDEPYDIPAILFPFEETLSISDFNKRVNGNVRSDVDYHDINEKDNYLSDDETEEDYIPGTRIKKPRIRGIYETDEEYVAYLADYYGRYFPQSLKETRRYDVTKDQIIQGLPKNFTQQSCYTDLVIDSGKNSMNNLR